MAETQQTMTEFTFAPGEKNIIGDRFSPSVIIFWLKTSIAASSTRIQYTTPNTLFGLIPLGVDTKTIPLRNVASVDTSTKFNLGSLVWGVVFLLIGLGCLDSSVAVALVLILVAAANLANTMSAQLDFVNQAGGRNSVKVSILEKDKLMQLAQNIQRLVFADVEGQRHQESMDMAQKQYTAQTNSVLIQQQLLNFMLLKHGYRPVAIKYDAKRDYARSLETWQVDGDPVAFCSVFLDCVEQEEHAFIDLVEGLRRKPDAIRSKTDLLDRFGDTLRKNLDRQDGDGKSIGTDRKGPARHMGR